MTIFAIVLLAAGLSGCGNDAKKDEQSQAEQVSLDMFIDESSIPTTIATVNGEDIDKDIFVAAFENMIIAQRISADDENVKDQLNELQNELIGKIIDERLLTQAADKDGIDISEQEIDEKLLPFTAQFETEKELEAKLKEEGFTMDELRADMERLLKLDKFIEQNTEKSEITDEALQKAYDDLVKSSKDENPPSFDEYKDVLHAQLEYEQQEQQMSKLVADLRKESEITIYLNEIK